MKRSSTPYAGYLEKPAWRVLETGVKALAHNGDIDEQTSRAHIVGYLAKLLTEAGFEQVSKLQTGDRVIHVMQVETMPQPPRAKAV